MKVTIQDIAKAANVAKSTVSKVLNDSPKISDETKARVREIMKQMNYTPSSIATRLAKRKSHNIGILFDISKESEHANPFFYNILVGIESVISPLKYELTIANLQQEATELSVIDRLIRSGRIDGLITNSIVLNDEMIETLNDLDFPFVSMGEYHSRPVPWVDYDNAEGGRILTGHLLAEGYSDIAFIGGEQGEYICSKRHQGYSQALLEAGIGFREDRTIHGVADENHGFHSALELLRSHHPPDSLVCMNNYVAFGALKAAQQAGISIPGQLGIATFDDYPFSPYTNPPLTSLFIDTFELGATAARVLIERINQPELPSSSLLLQSKLIVRESTLNKKAGLE
ncbi:LacI family DNA-binding transcriptional regulator [Paenibacillus sp. HN-1]|uniref:LacI family DNA-binding transcriptional regulator n=1 Tax=Paenibacillus TaxID=44249 RepID=UPI001CA7D25C|nr:MULTISPECIES: LacI family DNA-binding transcriptional regulator [Paenibacillus]MBY9077153.1 LacI family DNA-binding transcriptional regulator [Paenibacillus sp. CGMCC 1.18879]MBY9087400.1 LacI family DNA-binding transcriptional regulator [Paenibacillus sinensis]